MVFIMFDFKKFFSHHNTDFIVEANRGDTPESSVLLDNEDLDFLYQVDYEDWASALSTRYEVLLDELKRRDSARRTLEARFWDDFKKSYPTREDRENISLDSFVDFVKRFASQYNDYGKKIPTPVEDKIKFKNWESDFRKEYSKSFDRVKRKSSKDFLSDLRYMIFNYIVPFIDEKPGYPIKSSLDQSKSTRIKFYINRLIQKLETSKGESITLPDNAQVLKNLSRVLMSEIPVEMQSKGSYGFDLNTARMKNITLGSNPSYAVGKTRGFIFPTTRGSNGIPDLIRDLIRLNYQRHMGPLPSDENFKKYSHSEDGKPILTYRLAGGRRPIEDNFNYELIKKSIYYKIKNFIERNRDRDKWSTISDLGLYDIIDSRFRNDIESGAWATSSSSLMNKIFSKRSKILKDNNNSSGLTKERIVSDYVSDWRNISGNRPISDIFTEYFAEKQVDYMLQSGKAVSSPRILDGETKEERQANYDRIDVKLKKEIESKLSREEIEEFINSGRLSLGLKSIRGKKKLIPGGFGYAPVIMPFINTTVVGEDGESKTISVPLVRPGKYLSGVRPQVFSRDQEDESQINPDEIDSDEESGESENNKIPSTPSTSDRTSIYKLKDNEGNDKEVKVIDAQSTDRYVKKRGTGGAYYAIDTKGASRKYSFNRWKESDINKFMKVWAHPDKPGQVFDRSTIIRVYSGKGEDDGLFGKYLTSLYDDVDAYDFYKDEKLPVGLPFSLRGYRVGKENEIPKRDDEKPEGETRSASSTATSNLGLTILPSDSAPEIIGFEPVVKAIKDCLSMKVKVCANDGNVGFRVYLLENPDKIQQLHDYVVKQTMLGKNRGIWKDFLGEDGQRKSPKYVFCSIIGKWLQAKSSSIGSDAPIHGQTSRKDRRNLIGASSVQAFMSDLDKYKEYVLDLGKKNQSSGRPSSLTRKVLNSIKNVKALGDDDDDQITDWFYPGYKELDSKSKGDFLADKNNFAPDIAEWKFGPPTELRKLLTSFYETDKSISQEDKDSLLEKIKQEKEYLVGNGSYESGIIGLDSYIFNQKTFDEIPENSDIPIRQQILGSHKWTNGVYNKDIEIISQLPVREKEQENDQEEKRVVEKDPLIDEQNEYLKDFKQKFLSLSPLIRSFLLKIGDISSLSDDGSPLAPELTNNISKIDRIYGKTGGSTQKFVNLISSLYIIFGSDDSLLNNFSSFVDRVVYSPKKPDDDPMIVNRTTGAEQEFVKKNPGSSTKDFLKQIELITNDILNLNLGFNSIIDSLINSLSKDENYRKSLSLFFNQLSDKDNKILPSDVLGFFRSNIYKPGGLNAPNVEFLPYKDNTSKIEKIYTKILMAIRSSKSILRRVDAANLLNNPDFTNVGKISRLEVVQVIKAQPDIQKKKEIAKRVKEFYISRNSWNSLDSYFKGFIDNTINQ